MKRTNDFAPVRNPRSQPRDNYTGAVCVTRCGFRMVNCESLLEIHYGVQRDAFDFGLQEMISQPMTVGYFFDGKWREWTPDFMIRVGGAVRRELVEIKTWSFLYPEDDGLRAWRHAKFAAIADSVNRLTIRRSGQPMTFKFVLCTDREIRVQPRQYNADLMAGAVSRHGLPGVDAAELALLSLPHRSGIPELQRLLGPRYDALAVALNLAWRGTIRLDPGVKWSRETAFERTARQFVVNDP